MTAPDYNTDLTDFEDFEAANTISTELVGYTATAKGDDEDADFPIQGTQHASAEQRTAATGSLASDYGSNITWTSGWNFFLWGIFLAPAAVNSDANGGIEMAVGNSISAYWRWTVGGNDFGRYPYGGWQNFVVDPEISTGRTTVGTPTTGNYRWVGMLCDVISAIAKGSPYGIDVIRYGRGEIEATYGEAADYATFDGMATENDSVNNKWGLFSLQAGSYLWKGLMSLGNSTTIVDFRDENRNIIVDNSRNVLSTFNLIEINNASSNVEWTNINIVSLCTVSPGQLEVINDADFSVDRCQFTDMDSFIFDSNTILDTTVFRRCGLVTQGEADIDDCTFEEASGAVALLCDDLDNIDNCIFISDGTGHAIELTSAHAGSTFTLTGTTFSGYASTDGSTGNESIYNNSGGAVTINVVGGTLPTIRNGTSATTTLIIDPVTTTITVLDIADYAAIDGVRVLLEAADATGDMLYQESVTLTASGTTASASHTGHGLANGDIVHIRGANEAAYNGVFAISNVSTNAYDYTMLSSPSSPATGTITATEVIFNELTGSNGEVTDTRSFSVDQNVTGRARKSTSTPFYKTQPITGVINSGSGWDATLLMISDE